MIKSMIKRIKMTMTMTMPKTMLLTSTINMIKRFKKNIKTSNDCYINKTIALFDKK